MPTVSIIMPVYNSVPYLKETLKSLRKQTFSDFEIIAVDDGSSDASRDILNQYAENEKRLKILQQANKGAGAARNYGMQQASGKYLVFLDADDLFEPDMLEKMHGEAERTNADIVFCNHDTFDSNSGRTMYEIRVTEEFRQIKKPFSLSRQTGVVGISDFAKIIAPWHYLYSRQFIQEQQIVFQEIQRTNDLYFSVMALILAERISFTDQVLVHYRKGTAVSLQDHNEKTPLCFYEALSAVQKALASKGYYEFCKKDFSEFALEISLYNLESQKTPEIFALLFRKMKERIFPEFKMNEYESVYDGDLKERYQWIMQHDPNGVAYWKWKFDAEQKKQASKLENLQEKYDSLLHSGSYRLGKWIQNLLFPFHRKSKL